MQENSSDWSEQSGIPLQCLPSGTQLASDQQVNCVCGQPADIGRRVLRGSMALVSLCIVLIAVVVVVVTVVGSRRPPSMTTKRPLVVHVHSTPSLISHLQSFSA